MESGPQLGEHAGREDLPSTRTSGRRRHGEDRARKGTAERSPETAATNVTNSEPPGLLIEMSNSWSHTWKDRMETKKGRKEGERRRNQQTLESGLISNNHIYIYTRIYVNQGKPMQ